MDGANELTWMYLQRVPQTHTRQPSQARPQTKAVR